VPPGEIKSIHPSIHPACARPAHPPRGTSIEGHRVAQFSVVPDKNTCEAAQVADRVAKGQGTHEETVRLLPLRMKEVKFEDMGEVSILLYLT
jgi:hypothetical protein